MGHQRFVSAYPKSIHFGGRQTAGNYNDPLKQSPCRNRPNTNLPCPLLNKPKDNKICQNCGLIPGKGSIVHSDNDIYTAIKNGLFEKKEESKSKKIRICNWPGCDIEIRSGQFCTPHGKHASARRFWYLKKYGEEPTYEWLTRPVKSRNKLKPNK